MKFNKKLTYILTFLILILTVCVPCSATSSVQPVTEVIAEPEGRIICISHRGDTENFPANSLEGVLSALGKGADMVSVNVEKTKDGVFVLCEDESLGNICDAPYENVEEVTFDELKNYSLYDNKGNLTEYKISTLEELLEGTEDIFPLILDINSEDKDAVYDLLKEKGELSRVYLRTYDSAKKITRWVSDKTEKPNVIGIYDGNIIFNSVSHINTLSEAGMSLVQYQSKNYFNVMYGSLTTNNFSALGKARAIAPTYNPDLCGQRSDSENGWNELIRKGFTVIETNNTESLVSYIKENTEMRVRLSVLLEGADKVVTEGYSQTSKDNLTKAISQAQSVLSGRVKSLDEAENAYSVLLFSMNEMKIADGEETAKGALNITAGKVVATVFVGAAILAGQIFVQKLHRKKKIK